MASKEYKTLADFITNQMKMSHIYQPVMLIELLGRKGSASTTQIAKALLGYDISPVEYYEHIVRNMVGKVLTESRAITSEENNQYSLNDYEGLSQNEISDLIELCHARIEKFLDRPGDKVWEYKEKPSRYISGTLRYELSEEVRSKFNNVTLLPQDYALLKKIAEDEQKTMTQQISVIIRQFVSELDSKSTLNKH